MDLSFLFERIVLPDDLVGLKLPVFLVGLRASSFGKPKFTTTRCPGVEYRTLDSFKPECTLVLEGLATRAGGAGAAILTDLMSLSSELSLDKTVT